MRFGTVPPSRWADARDLLLPALRWAGDATEQELQLELEKGTAQLWIGEDSAVRCAVVTCISRSVRGPICEIWLLGGRRRRDWLHFIETIEDAARAHGCVAMQLIGRKGWARVLPGYREKAVQLEKDIDGMGSKKTKTKNEPWAPAQPYILKGMAETSRVFDENQPRLQDMSKQAYDAFGRMAPSAFGATPFVNNAQAAAQTISNGYFLGNNPGQRTYDRMQNPGSGGGLFGGRRVDADPSTAMLRDAAAAGGNPATAYASGVAGGRYLNAQPSAGVYSGMMDGSYSAGNPYIEDMVRQAGDDVRTNTNRMFAARGMGSGVSSAFADVVSRNLADSANTLRYQNYNDAENRRLQAAGQSDAVWAGERGRMDGATGLLSSDFNAAKDRQLAAAQALAGQYNQAQDRSLEAAKASDAARSDQVQQMLSALGLTGDLRNAEYAGVTPALSVLNTAADVPYIGVGALNGNIRTASNGYGVTTQKTSGGLAGDLLGTALGSVASGFGGGIGSGLAGQLLSGKAKPAKGG